MTLTRPQDVLVLLKLVASPDSAATYARLADEVGLSVSQVYRSLERAEAARLYTAARRAPIRAALLDFVLHGVRYAYPAAHGPRTRGMPTSVAAPPLRDHFAMGAAEGEVPVWPDPEGLVVGYAVDPLHAVAPRASRRDPALYELLALVDALREGRTRERALAADALRSRIDHP
ncbi:hypothetical protein [Rubrivirga sp.]|uniref:hypothetical protein n=1 Tax=Rubrivirga sp. TaxID=1885344 RepID=UPI003B516E3C